MEIYKDYILPTILIAVELALDLLVNRKFNTKSIIPCIIDSPKSILLLSMGFIITYTCTSTNSQHSTIGVTLLVISFLLSLVIYSLCDYSFEQYTELANNKNGVTFSGCFPLIASFILSMTISIVYYFNSVITCLGGIKL